MPTLTEALSIPAAVLDPASRSTSTFTTGAVDLSKFRRAMFVVMVGSVGAAGEVDAKLQQSATGSSGWTDLSGGAITTIDASNKIATLEVLAARLTEGQRYVRLSMTVSFNAVLTAVLTLGGEVKYQPASAEDIAAVVQRLVL